MLQHKPPMHVHTIQWGLLPGKCHPRNPSNSLLDEPAVIQKAVDAKNTKCTQGQTTSWILENESTVSLAPDNRK